MHTILVPTDFSPEAKNASVHAAELARTFNAKLFLFHAYLLPTPVSEVPYVMVTVDELQKENELQLKRESERLSQQFGLRVESLVRIGIPSDEVKVLTEEKQIDLIVMGMKGLGGLDKMIGSTTINAVRKVKVPVLIVPHDVPFRPVKVVTYASDLSYKINPRLFEPLLDLLKAFNARLQIVHIRHHQESKATDDAAKTTLLQLFATQQPAFDMVTNASIMAGLRDYMDTHPGELLVMVSHKHTLLERLFTRDHTAQMAYKTNRPLLILQDRD
jgi:nucleotide-binding universal stress UspA family protein